MSTNNIAAVAANSDVLAGMVEVTNDNTIEKSSGNKGRKLTVKDYTYTLDEGEYKGTITDAFWFRTKEDRERVMLFFELDDGTEFMYTVDDYWIERYPFSRLISQANVEYVEDFIGLNVKFTVRNREGETTVFSNIKKINLDE